MGDLVVDFFSDFEVEEAAGIGVNWGNHAGGVVDDAAEVDVAVDGHGDAVVGILKGFSGI